MNLILKVFFFSGFEGGLGSQSQRLHSSYFFQLKLFIPFCLQSIVRVVFHERRLQYMEHQQLEGWRWNRPGDRILDIGEGM